MTAPDNLIFESYSSDRQDDLLALWQVCDLTRPWNNPLDDIRQCVENQSSELLIT